MTMTATGRQELVDTNGRILATVRNLAFARDLEAVTSIVRGAARELTGADGVTFVLRDGAYCHYADEDAIAPLWKGRRFRLGECISGWVMLRGEPVTIQDVFADPRIPHDAYRRTFVKSLLMVPVRTPDPVAAIGAYWATVHQVSREEVNRLRALAEGAALALANVQLYQDLGVALELEREARREAEAAGQAKENFLAILSHELRQPLSACTAAMALLKTEPAGSTLPMARGVLDRQLAHMTRIVMDLLDASRIVRGEAVLNLARVDLKTVIYNAAETTQPLISERGHTLRQALPTESCEIVADSARLEQVFVNLLTNAAKYTPPGGRITVSLSSDADSHRVVVQDNGDGLDPDALNRIFELFARGSKSSHGLGIGLAVARRLVEQHGGTVLARSQGRGSGSEFAVRLPRRAGELRASA